MQPWPTLTNDLRRLLRAAIDAHQRHRRQAFIDAGELEVCAGCGGDHDNATVGCKSCWDRKRRRARRDDPACLERERVRQQRARHRRAELQRARRQRQKSVGKSCPLSVQRSLV